MESPKIPVVEAPPRDETVGFDLRSEIRDAKTGRVIKTQHYIRMVDRNRPDRDIYFRDGKYYYITGEEAVSYGTTPTAPSPAVEAAVKPQATIKK